MLMMYVNDYYVVAIACMPQHVEYALPLRSVIIESIENMLLNMHKREFETK